MLKCVGTRKTKIVCTIGPATNTLEGITRLIEAGMDVARLNFSHGTHAQHREVIGLVRQASRDTGKDIAILQDLCGPKIRVGEIEGGTVELRAGELLRLIPKGSGPASGGDIEVSHPRFGEEVKVGDAVFLADGLLELCVEGVGQDGLVTCRVVIGGILSSRKGVNIPSSPLKMDSFTQKDREDLAVGLEEGVDIVALSFVRHEDDLLPVREMVRASGASTMVLAKIEKPQALERLEQILAAADGLMVARGDLGVEVGPEVVPIIQKKIIKLSRHAGKPVITATQMLASMVASPRPSRAEAADVANAILDGTDALMLSEETAAGSYPFEAVCMLGRIAVQTEPELPSASYLTEEAVTSDLIPMTESAISRAAAWLAQDLTVAAMVASTTSGSTPKLVARFRPRCPIVALTNNPATYRQLNLSFGVIPYLAPQFSTTDEMFEKAREAVVALHLAERGERLVITAGVPTGVPGRTNLVKVIEVE